MKPAPLLHRGHLLHIVDYLRVWLFGHEIPDQVIAFIAGGAYHVVLFIHAVAGGENVLCLSLVLIAHERLALDILRNFHPGQRKQGRAEIYTIDQAVADRTGFDHSGASARSGESLSPSHRASVCCAASPPRGLPRT